MIVWGLLWSVVMAVSPVAVAKNTDSQLKDVEQAINLDKKRHKDLQETSIGLSNDLKQLKVEAVRLAAAIQRQEISAFDLNESLNKLRQSEKKKLKLLAENQEQFSYVLMALQRMARYPPESLIVAPISPSETVRVAILLRAAVPAIEKNASILRQRITDLVSVRNQSIKQRQKLASLKTDLDKERKGLNQLLAVKKRLKRKTDTEVQKVKKRMQNLVAKASSLRDLMSRLEVDRKKRQKTNSKKNKEIPLVKTTIAHGNLPYPAVGRLVGRYGQAMKTGLTRKGISIETESGAQVVVPRDGTVVFAGAFKGYGQLLIIEHDGGYLSLLAGLARIDSTIGQQVLSGEPAGVMGKLSSGFPVLYVELRRKGQPINPLPWLATRKLKANG